jgi:hypothetical protein
MIEDLKTELKRMEEGVAEGASSNASAESAWAFMRDSVVPFLSLVVDEMGEMDETLEEAYHEMPDALHAETAQVFAGIITSGAILVQELRTRVGNDQRLIRMIKEWTQLAADGTKILSEITIPDRGEDDDDDDEGEGDAPDAPATEGGA